MKKFMTILEYDGTAYHGWQFQTNLPTVQGAVEQVLGRILGNSTRVHGAGRTDAGVHARGQVAHFFAEWRHEAEDLQRALNALLPPDITVHRVILAANDFHARHSARSKTYAYHILNRPSRSPLVRLYSWHVPCPLDLGLMEEAIGFLLGSHDFASFGAPTDGTPSTVREILRAQWNHNGTAGTLTFEICGTGFLRYMVRSLVGTLVRVGQGKLHPEEFSAILRSRDRSLAGPTAPAHGLCLESVDY